MSRWIANWVLSHAPSPEKQAERALSELRVELYQAEQRMVDTQMHANYCRARLISLGDVVEEGIKRVSDRHKSKQESTHVLRAGLRFMIEL